MKLSNTRTIPASSQTVWSALNDPALLKDCLPGCESLEPVGDHIWRVVMAARVGPISARFNGRLTMTDIEELTAYTLLFDGQGGVAGFVRGAAHVALRPEGAAQTTMSYTVDAQIGGKLAQIGSRLIDGAASMLADQFFACFVQRVSAEATPPAALATDSGTTPPAARWMGYVAIIVGVLVIVLLYLNMR